MKSDIIHTDDGLRLIYFSKSDPSISITVSRGAIYEASRVAAEWSFQGSSTRRGPAMSRFADGDFSFASVCQAARELAWMARTVANRPRYRGQAEHVELLTVAHRTCARAMANVLMTDDESLVADADAIERVVRYAVTGTTDHEIDDTGLRDDLKDRGQE